MPNGSQCKTTCRADRLDLNDRPKYRPSGSQYLLTGRAARNKTCEMLARDRNGADSLTGATIADILD